MKSQAFASAIDKKIDALNPGESIKISGNKKCWVEVERSGDGQTLRFVRYTQSGFEVFKTCKF